MKIITLSLLAVMNLCLITSSANSEELVTGSIRDWCIRKQLDLPRSNPNSFVLRSRISGLRPRASLRRPGSSNIVAVLNIDEKGKTYFNPPGYLYGPIPAMKDITPAQADELWSQTWPSKNPSGNSKTYELEAPNSNEPILLDVVFEKEKCQRIRVKSSKLNSDWIEIQ